MKKLFLIALAACTAAPVDSPNLPSTELLAHRDAEKLCTEGLHLPTRSELEEILGSCDDAGDHLECAPCRAGENCSLRYGDDAIVAEGKVWSSTACEGGFLVGDFATGYVTCAATSALSLCVR